jgi:hypothetical protein
MISSCTSINLSTTFLLLSSFNLNNRYQSLEGGFPEAKRLEVGNRTPNTVKCYGEPEIVVSLWSSSSFVAF